MAESIVITGMGASTAVGRSAWACAAAVRAGISGFMEHPALSDSEGEPLRGAMAPWLDITMQGAERLQALLVPAIDEALAGLARAAPAPAAAPAPSPARLALALALPSARPGLAADIGSEMLARMKRHYGSVFASAAAFSCGHAGGLLGVRAACRKLAEGSLDGCVVAGVDSWLAPETLQWLAAADQLHGAGPLNNAWGFIPGEAGAALLLLREPVARSLATVPLASVLGSGEALESKRIRTDTVCIGEGLSQALRDTLAALPAGARVSDIYCDMNGEPYRADEFGFTALRTKEHFESASDFVAPADCWGDVGAAGGLLHLMLACAAGAKGYAKGSLALAWASSELGERAAVLLATAPVQPRAINTAGG